MFTQKPKQYFIHNGPKLETKTQIPIKWGRDKQTVVHPDNGLLLSNKKEMNYYYLQQHK